MALSHVSASFNFSIYDAYPLNSPRLGAVSRMPTSNFAPNASSFLLGSPLVIRRSSAGLRTTHKARPASIKCEQSTKEGNSLDVWLGRIAMMGFAVAISVEISTGKGLLENFGLTSPLPTVALAVTGLVGVLTAVFIFQSASKN